MPKAPLRKPKRKVCEFCKNKVTYVDYKDTALLRKYISDRGKIRARRVSGNCSQH
jgi:small subunit ribosomal protein S18